MLRMFNCRHGLTTEAAITEIPEEEKSTSMARSGMGGMGGVDVIT